MAEPEEFDQDLYYGSDSFVSEDDVEEEAGNSDIEMGEATPKEDTGPEVRPSFPFNDELSMHAILYLRSTGSQYSELEVTRLLTFAKKMCETAVSIRDQEYVDAYDTLRGERSFARVRSKVTSDRLLKKFPRPNGEIHFLDTHQDVPRMAIKEETVTVRRRTGRTATNEERKLYLCPPSEILKVCLAHPTMSRVMSRLPDRTPDQCIDMAQGKKWKEHPNFQWPMIRYKDLLQQEKQLWVCDTFQVQGQDVQSQYMVAGFYTLEGEKVHVECYQVLFFSSFGPQPFLTVEKTSFSLEEIIRARLVVRREQTNPGVFGNCKRADSGVGFSLSDTLSAEQLLMFNLSNKFKRPAAEGVDLLMDVKVVPLTLFSDDTSGNRSKKWNCFDSGSMTPAACL